MLQWQHFFTRKELVSLQVSTDSDGLKLHIAHFFRHSMYSLQISPFSGHSAKMKDLKHSAHLSPMQIFNSESSSLSVDLHQRNQEFTFCTNSFSPFGICCICGVHCVGCPPKPNLHSAGLCQLAVVSTPMQFGTYAS